MLAAVVTWAGLLAGAAGCTPGGARGIDRFFDKPRTAEEVVKVSPDDGSKNVGPGEKLRVRVTGGHLKSVTVVKSQDARDTPVPGHFSRDHTVWQPDDDRLALAAAYTVAVVADDEAGRRVTRRTTFATLVPEKRFIAYVTPEDRSVVGTGMIVSLAFNRPVTHRAAVERAIRVTADPPVEIRPHWFGSSRLDFRPREFWKPGTRVTVDLRLRDVEGAPGVYGLQSKTFSFTIGRSQISVVDVAAHTMKVRRDGRLLATLPITAGEPKHATYNGTMVVMEMHEVTRMNGATVGFFDADGKSEYDVPDVPHALRLTTSGTFLHGNYWSNPDVFGRKNVTHGCVGLRDVKGGGTDTPAAWFFDRSLIGDVVRVVNSDDKTVSPDNGLGGWNMDWEQWKAGSAAG